MRFRPTSSPILVGYGGGDRGRDALSLGEWLARTMEKPLVVGSIFRLRRGTLEEEVTARRKRAVHAVAEALDRLASTDLPHEGIAAGARSPARGLAELGDYQHAHLIVLGSTHRGPMGRAVPGGTAERLLQRQRRPVAIAPVGFGEPSPGPVSRVGVAFDGWAESRVALELAASLARPAGAALVVLMAADPHSLTAVAPFPEDAETALLPHREAAIRVLESTLAELPAGLRAEAHVLSGRPEAALAEAVEEQGLDLLVAGSRSYGPVVGRFLGSVSQALMRSCDCPLIVTPVRRPGLRAPVRGGQRGQAVELAVLGVGGLG